MLSTKYTLVLWWCSRNWFTVKKWKGYSRHVFSYQLYKLSVNGMSQTSEKYCQGVGGYQNQVICNM